MNEPLLPIVCDTTVVLNLGHRGDLTAVAQKLKEERALYVTPEVVKEAIRTQPEFYAAFLAAHFQTISEHITEWPDAELWSRAGLEMGEISVLAVCRIKGCLAGMDELAGRNAARTMGVKLMGTIGILQRAIACHWITEDDGLDALRRLRESGFHCPKVLANDDFADYISRLK